MEEAKSLCAPIRQGKEKVGRAGLIAISPQTDNSTITLLSIAENICLKDANNGTQLKINTRTHVERNILSLLLVCVLWCCIVQLCLHAERNSECLEEL